MLQPHQQKKQTSPPVFCWKRDWPDIEECTGLITIAFPLRGRVFETYFTRLDQALLLWGGVTAIIFLAAQFSTLDWRSQALYDSVLTLGTTAITVVLTWEWATVKKARWLLGLWSVVMVSAIALSDYSIVVGNGLILQHLCTGWLSICALGYFCTAVGLRSRAMLLMGVIHLSAVIACGTFLAWQFLITGSVLTLSLWLLGTWQWDHR